MSKPSCERCGSEAGLVHLTQIRNDQTSKHLLCEKCAASKGMQAPIPGGEVGLAGLLDQLLKLEEGVRQDTDPACPFCGLSFGGFRANGLLGCPECYETFGESIAGIVRQVHRGERHVGKVYLPPEPAPPDIERAMDELRRRLERAVRDEEFERAAEIRDRLRELHTT